MIKEKYNCAVFTATGGAELKTAVKPTPHLCRTPKVGRSVTSARTSGLSSIQGDLGESGKGIFTSQSY